MNLCHAQRAAFGLCHRATRTSQQALRLGSSSLVFMVLLNSTLEALLNSPVAGSVQPSFMAPRYSPSSASSWFSFSWSIQLQHLKHSCAVSFGMQVPRTFARASGFCRSHCRSREAS